MFRIILLSASAGYKALHLEAACSFGMLVPVYHAARRHITEDNAVEIYCDSVILSICFIMLFLEQQSVFM